MRTGREGWYRGTVWRVAVQTCHLFAKAGGVAGVREAIYKASGTGVRKQGVGGVFGVKECGVVVVVLVADND